MINSNQLSLIESRSVCPLYIQKLLFNDNGKDITRVLMCQDRRIVSIVSPYLSRADRIKIKKFFRKNGPEIIDEQFQYKFFFLNINITRYWVNIFPYYDNRKEMQQFKEFVKTLLILRTKTFPLFEVQHSFWSIYLDQCDEKCPNKGEMVDIFLKLVSQNLGERAVRKVALHEDGMGIVLLGAELQENKQFVNVMLSHLSDQDRDYVHLLIIENSPFNSRRQFPT